MQIWLVVLLTKMTAMSACLNLRAETYKGVILKWDPALQKGAYVGPNQR